MVLGMLAAPVAAINGGVKGLWIVYFLIGLFAGPQHPAFNTMVSAWFPQRYAGTPAHAVNKTKQKCNPAVLDDNVITLTMKSKSRFFDSNLKPPPLPNHILSFYNACSELPWASSICEAGPVTGNFVALFVAPQIASRFGWYVWIFRIRHNRRLSTSVD